MIPGWRGYRPQNQYRLRINFGGAIYTRAFVILDDTAETRCIRRDQTVGNGDSPGAMSAHTTIGYRGTSRIQTNCTEAMVLSRIRSGFCIFYHGCTLWLVLHLPLSRTRGSAGPRAAVDPDFYAVNPANSSSRRVV